MRILIIDNYDSFSYNLFQYFGELAARRARGAVVVKRNDEITVAAIRALKPDALVISPGPGDPDGAGVSLAAIRELAGEVPLLGVCLGHQAIGQAFGGRVVRAPVPVHGKASRVTHDGKDLFAGLPASFEVARYHSLIVEKKSLPKSLRATAATADGLIMALRHTTLPVWGVQFHPESILTPEGKKMIANFLRLAAKNSPQRKQRTQRKAKQSGRTRKRA